MPIGMSCHECGQCDECLGIFWPSGPLLTKRKKARLLKFAKGFGETMFKQRDEMLIEILLKPEKEI